MYIVTIVHRVLRSSRASPAIDMASSYKTSPQWHYLSLLQARRAVADDSVPGGVEEPRPCSCLPMGHGHG